VRGTAVTYLDYSGGRNTQNAPYLLSEKQCREQLNTHSSLSGDVEKRTGFATLSGATLTGSPVSATGAIHTLFPANTATKSLIGVAPASTKDKIFKMTTGGVATVLKEGLALNTRWYFAQADVNAGEGPVFGMNGADIPQRWNGSAASTSDWVATTGTVPKGKFLTYFSSRLWCLEGSRLRFSGLTGSTPDPMSWPAENYVDLDPNDGQEGTGIGIVGSYLVVFKARKTYVIYDPITGANRQVSNQIGSVAHRSIVQTPAGLFFLSEDQGICRTDGQAIKPFSEEIEPDLDAVASSPTTQTQAAGTLEGQRYYLSVSMNGTRNDHTIEYDLENKSWWLHDCAVNQFALLDPSGSPVLYSADSLASARVSKAFVDGTYTDNGSVYAGGAFWASPWYAWGIGGGGLNPHVRKRLSELRVDGVGNWDASLSTDFEEDEEAIEGEVWEAIEDTSGTWGGEELWGGSETTWGANPQSPVERRYYTVGLGRAFSFRFVDKSESNFAIRSMTAMVTPRSD
jgi:hypothetical protein